MALLSLSAESRSQLTRDRGAQRGTGRCGHRREVVLDPGEPELWASIPPIERRARARAFNGKRIEERNGVDRS
jgi:hypothetical protein